MDIKSVTAIAAVLGAAGGFGGSYYVLNEQTSAGKERLNQSPPIVVVDFTKVAASYPAGASAEEVEADGPRPMMRSSNSRMRATWSSIPDLWLVLLAMFICRRIG